MKREPVAIINAMVGLIEAGILLFINFSSEEWSDAQVASVMGVVAAIGILAKTLLIRKEVTPVSDPRDNQGNQLTK